MTTYNYSNVAIANTIGNAGGISNSATSLQATSTPSGYPSAPFKLRLDPGTGSEEVVKVTAGAGTSGSPWTIVRGWDGTTAVSHSQGAALQHGMSAEDLSLSRTHEAAGQAQLPHGLPTSAWSQAAIAAMPGSPVTVSGSSTSVVTFSSIPQNYTHLLVAIQGRLTSTAAQFGDVTCTVNGDTTSKYSGLSDELGTSTGSLVGPVSHSYSAKTNFQWFILLAASQAGTSVNAGGGWAFFPNYAGTSFNKMFVSQSGYGNGSSSAAEARERWGWYNPTSQVGITSLSLAAAIGNFVSGSSFSLYGIS